MADTEEMIREQAVISVLQAGASSYVAGEQRAWIEAKPGVQVKWLFRLQAGARTARHDAQCIQRSRRRRTGDFYARMIPLSQPSGRTDPRFRQPVFRFDQQE